MSLIDGHQAAPLEVRTGYVARALENVEQAITYAIAVGGDLLPEAEKALLTEAAVEASRLATYVRQEDTT